MIDALIMVKAARRSVLKNFNYIRGMHSRQILTKDMNFGIQL